MVSRSYCSAELELHEVESYKIKTSTAKNSLPLEGNSYAYIEGIVAFFDANSEVT